MKKINVVGTSASGKSTFSRELAKRLDVDHIELDALFWGANWSGSSDDDFLAKIERATRNKDGWVIDGNYTRTIPVKWREVQQVIWLDVPFAVNLYQSIRRAINRS